MTSYINKLNFGLSFALLPNDGEALLNENFPEVFTTVELAGTLLDQVGVDVLVLRSSFSEYKFTDLMPLSVTREISDQPTAMVGDFRKQLGQLVAQAGTLNASSICIDFGLSSMYDDEERTLRCLGVIRDILPMLYKLDINLTLPVRVPSSDSDIFYLEFIAKLMLPNVRFRVSVHPHELQSSGSPEELMRYFRFDLDSVRFVYEPETGNRIVDKLLEPWLSYLDGTSLSGSVIFTPRCSDVASFVNEASLLGELLGRI